MQNTLFGVPREQPLVINLTQEMPQNPDYHVGTLEDAYLKQRNGTTRKIFEWYPRDAVWEEDSQRLARTSVKPENAVQFSKESISPRDVYWLLPDSFNELPNDVKRATAEDGTGLGVFFSKFVYQAQAIQKALEIAADREPEIMDKVRSATRSSELDDQVRKTIKEQLQLIEQQKEIAEDSSNNSD